MLANKIKRDIRRVQLIFLLFIGFSVQCVVAQVRKNDIEGIWTLDHLNTYAGIALDIKQQLDTTATFRSKIDELFVGRKVLFDPSGNYRQILQNGQITDAKWDLNGRILIITDPQGFEHTQRIVELTEAIMVIEPMLLQGVRPFIPRYFFIKN